MFSPHMLNSFTFCQVQDSTYFFKICQSIHMTKILYIEMLNKECSPCTQSSQLCVYCLQQTVQPFGM